MAARTITQPAEDSALSSSVIRDELQILEDEIADPSSINPGHLHTTTAIDAGGTPSSSTFLRGDNTWATPSGGSVTTLSIVTANGFAGTVTNPTTSPAVTLSTTVTGILLGNGTAVSGLNSTGTGDVVRATSPTLVTPNIGVATATTINGVTISNTTGTLTITSGKTLTVGNTLTFIGVDGSTIDFGTGGEFAYIDVSNAWADGVKQTFNPNDTSAGINVGQNASDPSSPANGDIYYSTALSALRGYINGAWVTVSDAPGTGTVTEVDTGTGLTGGPITTSGTVELATDIAPIATLGTAAQQIRVNAGATALEYFTATSGSGDVVGPASATDFAIVRFDGATGKLIQNSAVTMANTTGALTVPNTWSVTNVAGTSIALGSPLLSLTTPTTATTGFSGVQIINGAQTQSSGVAHIVGLSQTLNQTGTAGDNSITIGRVETALGSGEHNFLKGFAGALGTTEMFRIDNAGIFRGPSVTLGAAAGTTGSVALTGTTSGVVTLSVADAAGTWTLKLPTTDGNANEFLQTDGSGNTTWAAGSSIPATTITVANEATDTSCFPVFVTAATGDLGPKSNAGLTFNSNTALLTATLLAGTTSVTSATIRASSNDSGSLGASGTAFSDLFLASGAVIDFAAGNSVITHSSAVLTVSTGDLRVTTAGTNTASVVTVGGTQTLTNKIVSQTVEPAVDDTFTGEQITGLNAGATVAQWDAVYLGSSSKWLLTDADAASSAGGVMVGMATTSGTDTNPLIVILRGVVRNDGWTWATVGAPLYLDTATPGGLTLTAPSGTDDVIRIVAYVLSDDCIYWNPSNDFITHT